MSHSGAASFKKVSGIISIDEDASPAELTWRSTSGDKTTTIVLDTIDKLQATPATNEKMMLRLISKVDESKKQKNNDGNEVLPKSITHMFSFNNREVMDNIKITLQQIISRYKDNDVYENKRRQEGGEETSIFTAPLINTAALDDSLSSAKLLTNLKLQQSLLKNDKNLMKAFQETVINSGLLPEEFWATRVPLLRTFALSTSQKIGPYNVLSTIKPVASSENKVNVNLSREKILSIFQNYPIVRKAYDDNVPKNFKEQEFWARFFSSKLFRKLRGEKLMQSDRGDVIIDRYLKLDQEYDRKDDAILSHPVKKFIDIDGNVQDDSSRLGNRPDFTMKPGTDINGNNDGTIDILKGMNRLSEKMIMALENEYSRATLQNDSPDEEEKESLEILDLQPSNCAEYAMVHLKNKEKTNQNGNFSTENDSTDTSSLSDNKINPALIKDNIVNVINKLANGLDLTQVLPDKETSIAVNKEAISAVKINAKQAKHNNVDPMLGTFVNNVLSETDARSDLPVELLESCRILHSTCCEFLKHFYIYFQSGNYKQATKVTKLYKHLKSCIKKLNELFEDVKKGDGEEMASTCTAYLKPVLNSITFAVERYDKAYAEHNRDAMFST